MSMVNVGVLVVGGEDNRYTMDYLRIVSRQLIDNVNRQQISALLFIAEKPAIACC